MSGEAKGIDTSPVDENTAAAIERAEMYAWEDCYAAAPADWAESVGLRTRTVAGALVIHWTATGRRYFSRAIGLGVTAAATGEAIDEVLSGWNEDGISMFLIASQPHCRPEGYEDLLRERGLEPFDAQDRVFRDGSPPSVAEPSERGLAVERVSPETADEWAEFLQRVYRLDTGVWLQRLIGRPGWHEYVAREDGEIVAARGMFIGSDGSAWLGMDAPVPGLMTDDYEPDAALCGQMVADGLVNGARSFLADIEAPSPGLDTPAYEYFARLGFRRPYVRLHWTRP
ncbi:MAG: hypothetical protein E6G15_08950 [Actinobacteria bacterium]|nr:MAG: hypothetical protein E6G15_08950 [Actinomycetota bacterium]